MLNKKELRMLIVFTLKSIGLFSENAVELLMGTCAQESLLGKYNKQTGGGPALGIFQMEPNTFNDIVLYYSRSNPKLMKKIMQTSGVKALEAADLLDNKTLAICMARVHYLRVKEPLPSCKDIWAMGEYWKKYYNTPKGKGTVKKFVENYRRYVL